VGARRTRSLRDARRRAYGQNFLASRAIAAQLVRQAKVGRGDLVLEIGAGNGILTAELARQARRVFAVEIDPVWVARLRERFAGSAFRTGEAGPVTKWYASALFSMSPFGANTQVVPGPWGGDVTCCCSDRVKAELGGTECYTVTIVIL
jgi:protein-L-isoaspartate O-methyltransferase